MINLEQSLGLKIKLTTILDQVITGSIYSYSPQSQLITLFQIPEKAEKSSSNKNTYRIIKTSFIKSITLINPKSIKNKKHASSFTKFQPNVNKLEPNRIEENLKQSIKKYNLEKETINKDASFMGQEIFNKLYKTLPQVKWEGKSIIVLGELKIEDSYQIKNISMLDKNSKAFDLVKKIIDGFWLEFENERKGG